jgi:hypothetical protein
MSDIAADPYHERGARQAHWRANVLGARVQFTSRSPELLAIAQQAFARTPSHRWATGAVPPLAISLVLGTERTSTSRSWPPQPAFSSGAGLVTCHVDAHNFVVIDPRARRALIRVTTAMLRHPRLMRYELLEYAAVTLATRTQGLVPLHAGCVGSRGRGVLLVGASGSGKSTLTLNAAFGGLDFLSEDSLFVQPGTLCASGLSAFVHACPSALPFIADAAVRRLARRAPTIRRRSGVRKHEIDLRLAPSRLAARPLRIVASVVLSARAAAAPVALAAAPFRRILRAEQGYAVGQPGWPEFERRILAAPAFVLGRMPPDAAVQALRGILREAA